MARHNENGLCVARWLSEQPGILRVHYPGLSTHPDHDTARRQMRGFGAMLAVELRGGEAAARAFVSQLRLFSMAISLGGVESLVQFPAALTPVINANAKPRCPVAQWCASPWVVRTSSTCAPTCCRRSRASSASHLSQRSRAR